MTTSFVGLENLPNVYFRDISISSMDNADGQQMFSKVDIKLIVKDTKIDGKFQWVNDDLLNTYLNVKILQSLDKDFTEQLTAGRYTLQPFDYQRSLQFDRNFVKINMKRLRVNSDPEQYSVGNNTYEFEYKFSFEILSSMVANIAYFACISLNLDMLGTDFAADFNSDQTKYFQGPISSEKVFVDNKLQTKTNVFYLPDNDIWSGPVHLRDGEYMAGAFHSPDYHPTLRLSELQNLKLKDNRIPVEKEKKLNEIPDNLILMGNSYDTRDSKGNIKRLFPINIEAIFLQKTKYGTLIRDIDPMLYKKTINNFLIYKMVIKRKFVKKIKASSAFKNKKTAFEIYGNRTQVSLIASDLGPNQIKALESDEANIEEVHISHKEHRYFSYVDKKIKSLKYGNFIHSLEITFKDKTEKILLDLLKQYKTDIKELEEYNLRSLKPIYKNENKFFNNSFYENEKAIYNLENMQNIEIAPWNKAPQNFMNLKSYLYELSIDKKQQVYQKEFNSINPKTGTSSGITSFISKYKNLIKEFADKFDPKSPSQGIFDNNRSPKQTGTSAPSIYVFVSKNYDKIISSNVNTTGYGLFDETEDANSVGILQIGRKSYSNRKDIEVERFFSGNPTLDLEESKHLTEEEIAAVTDIASYSTSHFSPIRLFHGGRNVDLSDSKRTDDNFLNNTLDNILQNKKRNQIFSRNVSLSTPKRKNSSNDKVASFQDATDYLASDSKFLQLGTEFDSESLELFEEILVKDKFMTSLYKKRNTKMTKTFDLKSQNNIVLKTLRDKKKSNLKLLKKMPLHIKSLVTSRSTNVKTNFLSSIEDILASEKQNNKLLIQHFAVQIVEYFDGFKKNKAGNEIFGLPIWKTLDSESFTLKRDRDLLCRTRSIVDEMVDLSLPPELDFEIFDNIFIIKGNNNGNGNGVQNNLLNAFAFNFLENEDVNYDYSTTNPVVQPYKETGPFTEAPAPSKGASNLSAPTRNQTLSSRQRRSRSRSSY